MRQCERLVWTLGLLLALTACHKNRPGAAGPPGGGGSATATTVLASGPVAPAAPATPAAAPAAAVALFNEGAQAFAANDYVAADRNFQQYLQLVPAGGPRRDEALFNRALMSALKTGSENWNNVTSWLKQLEKEFPRSPLKPAAQIILKLREESLLMATETEKRDQRIRQLTTELDRLKQIDSERRQRP